MPRLVESAVVAQAIAQIMAERQRLTLPLFSKGK
jgi:hypothetical protein